MDTDLHSPAPDAPAPPAPGAPPAAAPVGAVAEMPFLDHLEELRWRLIYSLGAFAVGMVVAFALVSKVDVIGFLEQPVLPYLPKGRKLVFTHPGDVFGIVLNASLVFGLLLASPVIVYQIWAFLSPALYKHEKRVIVPVLVGAVLLFAGGVALAYYMVLPLTLGFLLTFQSSALEPMITARDYFGFATSMSLALGAVFELPILILALTALGLVTPALLNQFRRHAVVACVVGAAFITPGSDPLSMLALAGPLYLLFEVSVILSTVVYRRRQRREAAAAAAEAAEAAAEEARLAAERASLASDDRAPRRLDAPAERVPFDQQGVA
jgi:sec-independent protein translocase protein TatC